MKWVFAPLALAGLVSGQGAKDLGQVTCRCTNDNSGMPVGHPLKNSDYGKHCFPWDDTKPWCDPKSREWEAGNERWCSEKWCYVDNKSCRATLGTRTFRARKTSIFDEYGSDLYYSYETCGSKDNYRKDSWEIEIEWAPVCACTGDNSGNPKLRGTDRGKSCGAWDINDQNCDEEHESFKDGNELWCDKRWCYVQKGCLAEYGTPPQNYSAIRSVYDAGTDMFWSYETCDNPNFYVGAWNYKLTKCQARTPADVYLLVDSSGSMFGSWDYVQEGVAEMAGLFNATLGDRVSLTLFGGDHKNAKHLDDHKVLHSITNDIDAVVETAKKMKWLESVRNTPDTYTFDALDFIIKVMKTDEPAPNRRQERILVIVTDGQPKPIEDQDPCTESTTNPKWYDVKPELEALEVKRLLIQVRREISELDCLVEEKNKMFVEDPRFFFNELNEEFFCVATIPTKMPSPSPTMDPTPRPTHKPTPEPTERPSPFPTNFPTHKPTRKPTPEPTRKPTPFPTLRPTPRPSNKPTNRPTREPSPHPTPAPSMEPTCGALSCGEGTYYDEVENKCMVKVILECDEGTYYDKSTKTCKPGDCVQVFCGAGTAKDDKNTCMPSEMDKTYSCGLMGAKLSKGKKVGASSMVDDSCICQIYCAGAQASATAFTYDVSKKSCTCYTGNKIKFGSGNGIAGFVTRD